MPKPAPICPRFAESWLNEPAGVVHVVLGRRLRPFCLWHRCLLESVDSPFLRVGGPEPTLADLVTAVRVCRARYRTPLARILPAPPRGRLGRWWRAAHASWTTARYPLTQALAAFTAYLRDYFATPEFWEESGGAAAETRGNLPDTLSVVAQLLAGGTFRPDNEAAAWEMPEGKAHWYAAAFAKIGGADLRLRTESDQFLTGLRQLQKRIAARKAALAAKQPPRS